MVKKMLQQLGIVGLVAPIMAGLVAPATALSWYEMIYTLIGGWIVGRFPLEGLPLSTPVELVSGVVEATVPILDAVGVPPEAAIIIALGLGSVAVIEKFPDSDN